MRVVRTRACFARSHADVNMLHQKYQRQGVAVPTHAGIPVINRLCEHQSHTTKETLMRTTLPIRVKKLIGMFFIVLLVIVMP